MSECEIPIATPMPSAPEFDAAEWQVVEMAPTSLESLLAKHLPAHSANIGKVFRLVKKIKHKPVILAAGVTVTTVALCSAQVATAVGAVCMLCCPRLSVHLHMHQGAEPRSED